MKQLKPLPLVVLAVAALSLHFLYCGGQTTAPGVTAPSVSTQPVSQTVAVGDLATFSVSADGTAPLSYRWQKDGVDISGAALPSYTTPAAAITDNGAAYRCVIHNSAGSDTTNAAILTVTTGVPTPDSLIVATDIYCTFDTISAGSTRDLLPFGRRDTAYLNVLLKNMGRSNALSVQCTLKTLSPQIQVTTAVAGYNNIAVGAEVVNITRYKVVVSRGVPAGQKVKFHLGIRDSWGGYWADSCEWTPKPFVIDAQVVDDDSIPDSRGNGDGLVGRGEVVEYTPRLLNSTTDSITGVSVYLVSQYANATVRPSDRCWAYGDVAPQGSRLPQFDYVFSVADQPLGVDSVRFDLLIFGTQRGVARRWVLPALLPASPEAPTVVGQPQPQTVAGGQAVTFTVAATGSAPLSYQWQKSATDIPGATSASYTTPATTLADNGSTYRCVVINTLGSDTSNAATLIVGAAIDVDGNLYHSVIIGTQEWMVEDLRTTRTNDGTPIPLVTDTAAWRALTTPGFCYYGNDSVANKATYGALYNWYAVNTGKLAPVGWHVATDSEWSTLVLYLGDSAVAGGKLKETGTAHWSSPNTGATNVTGFTALPGGYRTYTGAFTTIGTFDYWWTATPLSATVSSHRHVMYASAGVGSGSTTHLSDGFSVRCVRD